MKIFAVSDIHGVTEYFDDLSEYISGSELVIISGDITKKGTREEALNVLESISRYNSNMLCVHGNMDRTEVLDLLEEKGYSLHARGGLVGDVGFFGAGGSSPTPINTPSEYSEERLMEIMASGYGSLKDAGKFVLVSHAPPRGTRDRTFFGVRAGSKSVRDFILNNRVDLCITGHIHEAGGCEMLKDTIVLNTGSFRTGKFAIIEINSGIDIKRGRVKRGKIKFK